MQKNTCALFDNWRQLRGRIGKGIHEVERSAELRGEVANAMPSYVLDKTNPCRITATVLLFCPTFWHTLALVRHIPLLIEEFLLTYEYTQSRLKSKYTSVFASKSEQLWTLTNETSLFPCVAQQ
jgi:hypothetical protein